jgi:tetratricopeptide (TPR) repeat protein
MTSSPAVFVSFSGSDARSSRKLISALERQECNVWDYSQDGEDIPPGAEIAQECLRRIDASDYFLAVLSDSTFDHTTGRYPRLETDYAIQRLSATGRPVIVPVVDTRLPMTLQPPAPYNRLGGLLRLEFDSGSQASVDEAVRRFCTRTLGVAYTPAFRLDPRIRLIDRFRNEYEAIEAHSASVSGMRGRDYSALERCMEEFTEEVSSDCPDWKEALIILGEAFRILRKNGLEGHFYFMLIMRGMCELELQQYTNARISFETAINHERVDAHAFVGLTQCEWRIGSYHAALQHLRQATVRFGGNVPWELQFNIAAAAYACGELIDLSAELLAVNPEELQFEDWSKYTLLKALYYRSTGRTTNQIAALAEVLTQHRDRGCAPPEEAVVMLSETLFELGDDREALETLVRHAEQWKSGDLYHRAARMALERHGPEEARGLYDAFLANPDLATIKYLLGYARVLSLLGLETETRSACNRLFSLASTMSIVTPEDHFYIGFAHYLCGNFELAEYERTLARAFTRSRYEELV